MKQQEWARKAEKEESLVLDGSDRKPAAAEGQAHRTERIQATSAEIARAEQKLASAWPWEKKRLRSQLDSQVQAFQELMASIREICTI